MTRLAFQVQVAKEQGGWPPYSKVIFKTIQNTGSSHPISQCRNSFRFGPRCVLMIMRRTSAAAAAAAAVAAAPTHCLRERLCTLRARPIHPPPPPPSPPLPISDIVHCVATTMCNSIVARPRLSRSVLQANLFARSVCRVLRSSPDQLPRPTAGPRDWNFPRTSP